MAQQYTNPWAQAIQARGEALKLKKLNAFTAAEGEFWLNHSYRGQFQVNPTGDGLLFKDSRGNKDFKALPSASEAFNKYKARENIYIDDSSTAEDFSENKVLTTSFFYKTHIQWNNLPLEVKIIEN